MVYRHLPEAEFKDISDRILYEDNHILIINKKVGEIVQGDKTGDECLAETLKAFIAQRDGKPGNVFMGIPHRLDRPVSGICMFAKTGKALERLAAMFRGSDVHKTYWALCCEKPDPEEGHLEDWLIRNEKQNKSFVTACIPPAGTGSQGVPLRGTPSASGYLPLTLPRVARPWGPVPAGGKSDAKLAKLNYRYLGSTDRYHLIEVELLTGRHHQIRCQLAHLGCVIKGDLKYGAKRSNPDGGICLHARQIRFIHPVKKEEMTVIAPLPSTFHVPQSISGHNPSE